MQKQSSSFQPEIISIGEPLLELSARETGPLGDARQFLVGFGGDTSNFSVAVSRLGGKAGYFTRLGGDEFGRAFLELWDREKVDCRHVTRHASAPTGIYFISRMKTGGHDFTYYRKDSAASLLSPAHLPEDYIRRAKVLHVTGISQGISQTASDTVLRAMNITREAGGKISYDPNFRPKLWSLDKAREVIHGAMALADFVFPSLEDGTLLTGLKDPLEIIRFYQNLGPEVVVLKMGEQGALMATGHSGQVKSGPGFEVDSVDASGAGDTFDAAFVAGSVSGRTLDECLYFANAAAAMTTTGLGAVGPIPTLDQVQKFISRHEAKSTPS